MGAEGDTPKKKPGDRLAISARKWNALGDLLGEGRTSNGLPLLTDSETRVLVHNATGADLPAFSVVKIGDVSVLPSLNEIEFQYKRIFEGETPAADEVFGITQQPIKDDEYGWAVVLGVTTCTLNVADAGDTHASPGTSTADLDTGTSGPAVILWKESGTGTGKKAKVLITHGGGAGSSDPCETLTVVTGGSLDEETCVLSLTTAEINYRDCT